MNTPYSPQVIEAEGKTVEEAKENIRSQLPEGLSILSVKVTQPSYGKSTWEGEGNTIDEAFAQAQSKLPINAVVIEKKVIQNPHTAAYPLYAANDIEAAQKAQRQYSNITNLKLVAKAKKGLFRKPEPDQYEIEIFHTAKVEIVYTNNAKVTATIGIPPELTQEEMQALYDLLEIFSNDYKKPNNAGFSQELEDKTLEWWYTNQGIAREIHNKLDIHCESGSHLFNQVQSQQLYWLLNPAKRLNSATAYTKDKIRTSIGNDLEFWSVDNLHIYTFGLFRGQIYLNECFRKLGIALGK
jgi:flagellar biosynthesis GTPase FlhF